MQKNQPRLPLIDALKAIASQFIVLHHLAFYGPLSEAAREALPSLFGWLAGDARIAVQVFLVVGGFLAANSLAPEGVLKSPQILQLVKKRYLKLVVPFLAAVIICVAVSAVTRQWLVDEVIPDRPTLAQFLAHAALLHGVLGFDSLSAGVWYIAIDFQLFVLLLVVLWSARHASSNAPKALGLTLVTAIALTSLFHFNRHADWDNWAVYFFGAYGLGAMTFWLSKRKTGTVGASLLCAAVVLALAIDFRSRILVALIAALVLYIGQRTRLLETWPDTSLLAWLGKISYSVFLIHFPVVLIANAVFAHMETSSSWAGPIVTIVTWLTSIAAGAAFHHYVESRSKHWQSILIDPVLQMPARLFSVPRSR